MVAFNPQLHLSVAAGSVKGRLLPPYISFPSLTNGDLLAVDGTCGSGSGAAAAALAAAAAGVGPAALATRSASGDAEDNSCCCSSTPCSCSSNSICSTPVELWVLLSRHVRERQRDLSGKYLAVHIYEGNSRVSCPPPPAKQGVYSNGECTLVKVRLDPKALHAGTGAAATTAVAGGNVTEAATEQQLQQQQQAKNAVDKPAAASNLLRALDYVLVVSQYSQKVKKP